MSEGADAGAVSMVRGGAAPDWMNGGEAPWVRTQIHEFKEGFEVGAGFSMAVMGAGLNAVTGMAQGHVKGNFG